MVFMTQAYMSRRQLTFKQKSKIWPQMTPNCQILSKLLLHSTLKFIESIDHKKNNFGLRGASKLRANLSLPTQKTAFFDKL